MKMYCGSFCLGVRDQGLLERIIKMIQNMKYTITHGAYICRCQVLQVKPIPVSPNAAIHENTWCRIRGSIRGLSIWHKRIYLGFLLKSLLALNLPMFASLRFHLTREARSPTSFTSILGFDEPGCRVPPPPVVVG